MRSRLIPFLLLSSACGSGPKADWVLRNGTIYTLDSTGRRAQSLAVGGGTILYFRMFHPVACSRRPLDLDGAVGVEVDIRDVDPPACSRPSPL